MELAHQGHAQEKETKSVALRLLNNQVKMGVRPIPEEQLKKHTVYPNRCK